mmetsp:Transcript_15401/g.18525  ORF Transcript_15401/g.18525 Transcript_15401/m.18525 type:complete len:184 (+) Transcript_15401:101-652(+)
MVAVVVKQEERCQVIACRYGQDLSTGAKFVLKPGDSIRLGRGRGSEVLLDYEGVSKHHAEIILAADAKLTGTLLLRDLSSKNGMGIRRAPLDEEGALSIHSFERLPSGSSQVVHDGSCVVIPIKSRNAEKQMTVEQRMVTLHVRKVMVDVPVPVGATPVVQATSQMAAPVVSAEDASKAQKPS